MNLNGYKYIIKGILFFLFFTTFIFAAGTPISAQTDDYLLRSEEITFIQETGIVLLEGEAIFKSADFELSADRFELDTKNKILRAFNNVVIKSEKDDLRGQSLEYNYDKKSGKLNRVEGKIGEIYFSGAKLEISSTSPVAGFMKNAEFTPCRLKDPHYHFKAKEIRINPDNTLTIYDIVPYIAKIPVFYLPYYSVTYDPGVEAGESQFVNTFPIPQFGYDTEKGITVEFSYPYQISTRNSGKIYYWQAGSGLERDEEIVVSNQHQLSSKFYFKNNYYYLYNYNFDDDILETEEKDFSSSLLYSWGDLNLEAGLFRNLLLEENGDRFFLNADYRFKSGTRAAFSQLYDSKNQELIEEKYNLSNSQTAVNWVFKYVDGEDYNYYPYLELTFPSLYSFKTSFGSGRVENKGVELNKSRFNLDYNNSWQLAAGISYHLRHNYRLDHYYGEYDQNYHFSVLNTGFRYRNQISSRLLMSSELFYKKDMVSGESPLPDDRENEARFLRPALSFELQGDYPDSAWAVETDGSFDLIDENWEEINLRFRKKEDCFEFFIGYEFIDDSINFGLSL